MLPIYNAVIKDEFDGIINISLVDEPAVEVDFITLSKEKELETFKSVDDEKHLLTGVIMTANKLIYRRNEDGFEYYIKYSPDVIRKMSEKLLSDMAHENIDIDHKQTLLEKGKVVLQEIWIKSPDKPGPFENIEDGSLLATYHVYDEEIWEMCKSDRFNGFSLCGYFGVEQELVINKKPNKKSMLKKIKEMLKSMLLNFGEIKTDNGILYYDGEELIEGINVTNENEEAVEDGDYNLEDGSVITIKDSKIEKIVAPEEPEVVDEPNDNPEENEEEEKGDEGNGDEPKDEPEEKVDEEDEVKDDDEVKEEEEDEPNEIEVLKAEIETLKGEIEALKETIKTIAEQPAAEPIAEEFKTIVKTNNKAAQYASYLNK